MKTAQTNTNLFEHYRKFNQGWWWCINWWGEELEFSVNFIDLRSCLFYFQRNGKFLAVISYMLKIMCSWRNFSIPWNSCVRVSAIGNTGPRLSEECFRTKYIHIVWKTILLLYVVHTVLHSPRASSTESANFLFYMYRKVSVLEVVKIFENSFLQNKSILGSKAR